MEEKMKTCSLCGKQVEVDKYFSRKSVCPKCGGDLHICMNCRFFSERAHNKCIEPKADFQRTRDKANFCDYFSFAEREASSSDAAKSDAIKRLEDLFKK
jgi:predicted RNA-binding Zn-ribbon protein involved in translation (DUF1610 family)